MSEPNNVMSTEVKVRRGRGPGKKPRHALTSIRIPVYVLEYFKQNFDNGTAKMRDVLEEYVNQQGETNGNKSYGQIVPTETPSSEDVGSYGGNRSEEVYRVQDKIHNEESGIVCEWCGLSIPPEAAWTSTYNN